MENKENYIKNICDRLSLSKKQLAVKFNKTPRTIDNWVNDIEMIPLCIKECLDLMLANHILSQEKEKMIESIVELSLQIKNESKNKKILEVRKMLSTIIESTDDINTGFMIDTARSVLDEILFEDK